MSQYQIDSQSHPTPAKPNAVANDTHPHAHRRADNLERQRRPRTVIVPRGRTGDDAARVAAQAVAQPVARIGIIGANATGMGIAMDLLDADIPVTVYEPARASLDEATACARAAFEQALVAGELTAAQRDRRVALLAGTINLHHLKDCDVIVEVTGASIDATAGLVRRLNEVARQDAILVTRLSSGEIDAVAAVARHPENVLGFQLSEGSATQVWEFVAGKATSERTVATVAALVEQVRKGPAGSSVRMNA